MQFADHSWERRLGLQVATEDFYFHK
jgi:hypothetical protein